MVVVVVVVSQLADLAGFAGWYNSGTLEVWIEDCGLVSQQPGPSDGNEWARGTAVTGLPRAPSREVPSSIGGPVPHASCHAH